jgi:hypothetical protein
VPFGRQQWLPSGSEFALSLSFGELRLSVGAHVVEVAAIDSGGTASRPTAIATQTQPLVPRDTDGPAAPVVIVLTPGTDTTIASHSDISIEFDG